MWHHSHILEDIKPFCYYRRRGAISGPPAHHHHHQAAPHRHHLARRDTGLAAGLALSAAGIGPAVMLNGAVALGSGPLEKEKEKRQQHQHQPASMEAITSAWMFFQVRHLEFNTFDTC